MMGNKVRHRKDRRISRSPKGSESLAKKPKLADAETPQALAVPQQVMTGPATEFSQAPPSCLTTDTAMVGLYPPGVPAMHYDTTRPPPGEGKPMSATGIYAEAPFLRSPTPLTSAVVPEPLSPPATEHQGRAPHVPSMLGASSTGVRPAAQSPQDLWALVQRSAASCSGHDPSQSRDEDTEKFLSRIKESTKCLISVMAAGGMGQPDLAIAVTCRMQPKGPEEKQKMSYEDGQIRSLNCVTLTVGDLKGHGELKTCQEHDRQMIDCLHVAWFWMRLREDALGDWEGADRRCLFAADMDLHVIFPVLCSAVNGVSCGAAAALAMLQWATRCSFHPKVGVTGELTLKGELLKVGGIDEKLRPVRRKALTKVVMPAANEEEARKEGVMDQVVLVEDVKGMVEAVVRGGSSLAGRLREPVPASSLACVHVARSCGVQRLELAVAPGLGRVFVTGLDSSAAMVHKSVTSARLWLCTESDEIGKAVKRCVGPAAVSLINWRDLTRRQVESASDGSTEQQLDLIINFPSSRREDSSVYGTGVALGLVALTYGLTLPVDLCLHGEITPGGVIAPAEDLDEQLLKACVNASKSSLILARDGVDYLLAGMLGERKLDVYQDTLKVHGVECMYEAFPLVFGSASN